MLAEHGDGERGQHDSTLYHSPSSRSNLDAGFDLFEGMQDIERAAL